MKLGEVMTLVGLLIASAEDIKKREISLLPVYGMMAAGVLLRFLQYFLILRQGQGSGNALICWLLPEEADLMQLIQVGSGELFGQMLKRLLFALLPGVVVWILAVCSGIIGSGDGWILMGIGCLNPVERVWSMLWSGLWAAGIWSLFLMAVRRRSRRYELPFVPFLLAGYLLDLLWRMGG